MLDLLCFIIYLIIVFYLIRKLHLQIISLPSLRGRGRGWGFICFYTNSVNGVSLSLSSTRCSIFSRVPLAINT